MNVNRSDDNFTSKYADVLQNIEFTLIQPYRQHDDMTDWEAEQAVNALIRTYQADLRGAEPPCLRLSAPAQEAYDQVKEMCEWRLGRTRASGKGQSFGSVEVEPISTEELIDCLKRIRRSIQLWHKDYGRRGYYNYVSQFIP